jgi:hypothetical protein
MTLKQFAAAITALIAEQAKDERAGLDALVSVVATLLVNPPDDRHERYRAFTGALYRAVE